MELLYAIADYLEVVLLRASPIVWAALTLLGKATATLFGTIVVCLIAATVPSSGAEEPNTSGGGGQDPQHTPTDYPAVPTQGST
jgi:hypothetical protein